MSAEYDLEKPNFDDYFLDNPPFNTEGKFREAVYRQLCETVYNRLRIGILPAKEYSNTTKVLRLGNDSIATVPIYLHRGRVVFPERIVFEKLNLSEFGTSYGFELLSKPQGRQVPSLIRYTFVLAPYPASVHVYPEGFPMEDELLSNRYMDMQNKVMYQLLTAKTKSGSRLPANKHGAVIYTLRLIRECLEGNMKDNATGAYFSPHPQRKSRAQSYNGTGLPSIELYPNSGWDTAAWQANWTEFMINMLTNDIVLLTQECDKLKIILSGNKLLQPEWAEQDLRYKRLVRRLMSKKANLKAIEGRGGSMPCDIPESEL